VNGRVQKSEMELNWISDEKRKRGRPCITWKTQSGEILDGWTLYGKTSVSLKHLTEKSGKNGASRCASHWLYWKFGEGEGRMATADCRRWVGAECGEVWGGVSGSHPQPTRGSGERRPKTDFGVF